MKTFLKLVLCLTLVSKTAIPSTAKDLANISKIALQIHRVKPRLRTAEYFRYAEDIYRTSKKLRISPSKLVTVAFKRKHLRVAKKKQKAPVAALVSRPPENQTYANYEVERSGEAVFLIKKGAPGDTILDIHKEVPTSESLIEEPVPDLDSSETKGTAFLLSE